MYPTNGLVFNQVVDLIIAHRRANPGTELVTDYKAIELELEQYTCTRLNHDPNWVVMVDATMNVPVKKKPFERARAVVAQVAERAGSLVTFSETLLDWLGAGQKPVPKKEAYRRAEICSRCTKNRPGNKLTQAVANAIREQTAARAKMQLAVPNEQDLKTCSACGCHLPLKVWVPLNHILENTEEATLHNLHPDCWMLPENRGRILVVLPFSHADSDTAIELLQWIHELGGCGNRRLLLVASNKIKKTEIEYLVDIANPSFLGGVQVLVQKHGRKDERWPVGANILFSETARAIRENFQLPWLWLEPDCVPLRKGWLREIEMEYFSAGKPFMGQITKDPYGKIRHLPGCSVYPADYDDRFKINIEKPFDLQHMDEILPLTHDTKVIHHYWGKDLYSPPRFVPFGAHREDDRTYWPDMLRADAALFHRNKDGSLIACLRDRPYVKQYDRDVTTVITTFDRPSYLERCMNSVKNAGIPNVVITAAAPGNATRELLDKAVSWGWTVTIQEDDPGNNASWLAGVDRVKTSHVHILHDDDFMNPGFYVAVKNALTHENPDVVLFDGNKHLNGKLIEGSYEMLERPPGMYSPKILFPKLMDPSFHTLSPVCGVMPTKFVYDTLAEAGQYLNKAAFKWKRPTMMVGNDLLLWLRAAQKFSSLRYLKRQLVCFGHHSESVSYHDATTGEGLLIPIYNRTRDYFLTQCPKVYHLVQTYEPKGETAIRVKKAMESWKPFYDTRLIVPLHIESHTFERNARHIGENREIPYLKDVLKAGNNKIGPDDLLVFTNDDTVLHPDSLWLAWEYTRKNGCVASFRFSPKAVPDLHQSYAKLAQEYQQHPGRDLFGFTKRWLRNNFQRIPDYVLGWSDWDSTLGTLMRLTCGRDVNAHNWLLPDPRVDLPMGLVWHEDHKAPWTASMESPANLYCRELTRHFKEDHQLNFEPWVNPS